MTDEDSFAEDRDDFDEPAVQPAPPAPAATEAPDALQRALAAERKRADAAEKQLRRERFDRLKASNPWLDKSHLEGIGLDRWEQQVQSLRSIAEQISGSSPPNPADDTPPEAAHAPAPPADPRLVAFTKTAASPQAGGAQTKLTRAEQHKILQQGGFAALRPYIEAGAVELAE